MKFVKKFKYIYTINTSALEWEDTSYKKKTYNIVDIVHNSKDYIDFQNNPSLNSMCVEKKIYIHFINPKVVDSQKTIRGLNFKKAAAGLTSKSFAISQNLSNWVISTSLFIFSFLSYFLFF